VLKTANSSGECGIKLHRTGTHPLLERMRTEIPEGVLEMLSVPGLHPDKVNMLYKKLGITSLAELAHRIHDGAGFGVAEVV